jgi:hypothetical protein
MSVELPLFDLPSLDRRLVAVGKPCLRQTCGHDRGSHIPSEGMECSECDCLGFVGFAQSDDSGRS